MKTVRKLIECAMLIAIATVLSLIKLVDLPYGGSVTAASMLPMVILAYRHGFGWGVGSALVYGALQQLLGLNTLSWVTTWQSVLAVILLDYVIAFAGTCLGGIFKNKVGHGGSELALGALVACIFRYVCHVISGCTVWAGLSIPTTAALAYSFAYNATYMIPETIVLIVVGYYIGSVLDFSEPTLKRRTLQNGGKLTLVGGVLVAVAVIFDTVMVFAKLQDAETGDFVISNLASVNWELCGIVSVVCLVSAIICFVLDKKKVLK